MSFIETLERYENENKLNRNEGTTGVKNLCRLVRALGYKDNLYCGQFEGASYGDLICFLEDNSGVIEAIKEWISENGSPEWEEMLGGLTNEERQAAADVLGYEVEDERIYEALEEWGNMDLTQLREEHAKNCAVFEAQGGRGVELADEIDDMRICIAVFECRETSQA